MPKRTDVSTQKITLPTGDKAEVEVQMLDDEEQKFLASYRNEQAEAAQMRDRKARAAVMGFDDDDLDQRHKKAIKDRADLEKQRQKIRDEQIRNSAEIAAIEQEQMDRRKAGFTTGDIGA